MNSEDSINSSCVLLNVKIPVLGVYWSYRVGDYRVICDIHDNVLTVEVIRIGHRSYIYKI